MKIINKPHIQIIIAMLLGYMIASTVTFSSYFIPLGDIFIRLLKMMIVPIVFTSITVGISSISDSSNISRLGFKTLVYYLSTSLLAIMLFCHISQHLKVVYYLWPISIINPLLYQIYQV